MPRTARANSNSNSRVLQYSAWIGLLAFAVFLGSRVTISVDYQRDFRTYYQSAALFLHGGNPYDLHSLATAAHDTLMCQYVYPPQSLPFLSPLTLIPYSIAGYVYFAAELFAIVFLLRLWKDYLPDSGYRLPLLIVAVVFSFNQTIKWDVYAGNICLFEQCLLWLGFAAFLKRRYSIFVLLVLALSLFKIVGIVFLGILLFVRDKRALQWAVIGGSSFLLINAAAYIALPADYANWLVNLRTIGERGPHNPSSLAFIESNLGIWQPILHRFPEHFGPILYAFYLPIMLACIYFAARRYDFRENRIALVMTYILTYAVLVPRLKDYSYILLIAPLAWVTLCAVSTNWIRLVILICAVIPVFDYQPFLLALLLLLFTLQYLRRTHTETSIMAKDRQGGSAAATA